MDIENIKKFQNILNNCIEEINNKIIIRKRKIDFKDILYGSIYKSVNNCSYDYITSMLNIKYIDNEINCKISKTAFIEKRNNIDNKYFLQINDTFIDYIYNNNKPRILAVDGSYLNVFKSFGKYGYDYASDNKNYCKPLISCIFDIDKKIPINYNIFKTKNEREAFREQLKYIKKDDILLFDRGYFSYDIVESLEKINSFYIFRLKENKKEVQYMKINNINDYIFDKNNIKHRVVHYRVENSNDEYYIYTNILDQNIDYFKDLYWKRWSVEINFKESKYNLSLININLKNENSFIQEIYIHNLIFILYYFFKFDNNIDLVLKPKYKLNNKCGIKVFSENIIYLLIYKEIDNKCFKKIKDYVDIILQNKIYIQENKIIYNRVRLRPYGKWYFSKK